MSIYEIGVLLVLVLSTACGDPQVQCNEQRIRAHDSLGMLGYGLRSRAFFLPEPEGPQTLDVISNFHTEQDIWYRLANDAYRLSATATGPAVRFRDQYEPFFQPDQVGWADGNVMTQKALGRFATIEELRTNAYADSDATWASCRTVDP